MGIYVDAEDLRQHFRPGNLSDDTVEEIMGEQETYVMQRLNLSELPPDHPILKNVVRDFTIAGCLYILPASNSEALEKANNMRREALRRLEELRDEGFKTGNKNSNIGAEVYNPYNEPFFIPSDFRL